MLRITLMIFLCALAPLFLRAGDQSIQLKGTINNKPASFIFDTGMPEACVLMEKAAQRLKLAVTNFGESDLALVGSSGFTEKCTLKFQHQSVNGQFTVLHSPPSFLNFPADGVIGWPSVSNFVVRIDAKAARMEILDSVPRYAMDWIKLPVETDTRYLRLVVPAPGGKTAVLLVDTGNSCGVELRPDLWDTWVLNHTNQPMTVGSGFNYSDGIIVFEEMWAKKVVFGPLTLTDVPIGDASHCSLDLGGTNFEATLGMAALRRLDFIVDGKHGIAYFRTRNEKAPPYKSNRLAAAFIPRDAHYTEFVAYVLANGPAYVAGIRNNDVLEAVNGKKVQNAEDFERIHKIFNTLPSGSKVNFTLKRGTNVIDASIVLRDILRP